MNAITSNRWKLVAIALASVMPVGHAEAASTTIQANAKVVKSITLTTKQNLDFGTITLSGSPGTVNVSVGINGAVTCPSGATCTGTARPAILNVQGSNAQTVRIAVANADLVSPAGDSIPFTPLAPTSLALTNSGAPGTDFNVGGTIAIPSTADGTYTGNVEVTVDYQ